ncbi:MAG: 16S rRNA (cytosine(967)-C(5))-methyltransferase [Candidatus Sedimenticola endophacoides]|nr:MAG: 16S rRNA (cytosine(967)-C(5))-methyltransferase [Candidatus Sedimenticola endophacoides]OQX35206.1 MAG: 16S rRNA (cytosine(967)-C(5))-methyltransferase [Candidatus Sedimenticola endophacoides]OQX41206.1 MAG: 16S rRNA (cytosine(967)-C(5))-methyltransferase [Candidatus Sedimenticola endophacoides]
MGSGRARTRSPVHGGARVLAARLVWQMQQGRSLSDLFETGLAGAEPADHALIKEICFGVARWFPQLEALGRSLIARPLKPRDGEVMALVYIGLYQLLHMRIPEHAVVQETVEAARSPRRPWATGLVNGVLRRFQRERQALLDGLEADAAALHALPPWLLERLRQAWPGQWRAIAGALCSRPPMTLRVNASRTNPRDYFERLALAALPARPLSGVPGALVLDQAVAVSALPGFGQGEVSVQDAGAQLAAALLDPHPGERVLDACAAPGGKSCHLLERCPDLELWSVDIDGARLERVRENLQRIGCRAHLRQGDAAAPEGDWARQRYDRILLDVPCSATGVIRRHPDIKLLRRDRDIGRLAALQGRILDAVWPLLKPGGMLVYATCSLLPEENQQQVERFLRRRDEARERPITAAWGHPLAVGRQTLPGEGTMDGFYYACLEKRTP